MHHTRLRLPIAALGIAAIFQFASRPAFASAETAMAGGTVTFSVAVDGSSPFTYQWYRSGTRISGATAATFSISAVQPADAGTYRVVVTNPAGTTTSDDATLAVVSPPTFTSQPQTQTVCVGGAVTFTAGADGYPAPTLQWQKNGVDIAGATGPAYTIAAAAPGDAGLYTVTAGNAAGCVTSPAAVLTVYAPPVFTVHPASQAVAPGASVTFTAAATGLPAPVYQWRKNGAAIPGATDPSLSLAAACAADAGVYSVVAANAAGSAISGDATLAVNAAPVFVIQPASQTAIAGTTVTFTAAATGAPAPAYQWYKNGAALGGATAATLTLPGVSKSAAGTYTVVAANAAGSATSGGAVLTVYVAPTILTQPKSQTVNAGATVTFSVSTSATPSPTYQWRKNGVAISGARSATYKITGVTADAAGTYSVVVTNVAGSATSTGAVLKINVPPVFTLQPASQTAVAGSAVTFTAAASGTPAPTFQWRKDGVAIAGATGATYAIASADSTAAGTYTVVATNAAGTATSAGATLTVAAVPPSFAVQPASWTVKTGAAVTLTAVADGVPAPAYQWHRNGSAIAGATGADLTLTGVGLTDAGTYSVVATNAAGSVTSVDAVLRVVDAAAIVPADFNFDGHSDLVCQNRATGERAIRLMDGAALTATVSLGVVGSDWSIAGVGDYNDDGNPDIFWQNGATGECAVWLMNGTSPADIESLGVVSTDWQMAAIGDFNGDGRADIVWQNRVTGDRFFWLTAEPGAPEVVFLRNLPTDRSIVGTGDFDGDGQTDLLWQNQTTGVCTIWLMKGVVPAGSATLAQPGITCRIVGTGDFDGDGDIDVVVEDTATGKASLWLMQGTRLPWNGTRALGIVGPDWWIRN